MHYCHANPDAVSKASTKSEEKRNGSSNGTVTTAWRLSKQVNMTLTDHATTAFSLRLFGPLDVRLSGEPLPRLRSRKGQWLLALLTLRHDAEVSRSWLAGLLWPDSSEAQALAGLRNSLMDLRRAMGPEGHRLESPTPATLRLRLDAAEADVVAFDEALARGDTPSLDQAVSLYRGPLLEGCLEEWVFQERQSREQVYLGALEQLATVARDRGEPGAAERYLRLAAAVETTRETVQRALMRLLADSGNYAGALQTYRDLRLHLHRELNAEPDPETRALFDQIRSEARIRARTPAREGFGHPIPPVGSSQPLTRGSLADSPLPPEELGAGSESDVEPDPGPATLEDRGQRIVLLYRLGTQPDEHMVELLETQLRRRGCRVFADRNSASGVAWAREIESQICSADVVIPLLSVQSMQSETLAGQVQIADEAARQQDGRPRLLPVRIDYTGPLPHGPLAAILDPMVFVLWRGPRDDERLTGQLLDVLEEALPPVRVPRSRLEAVGGAVPLDSQFYVVRRTDPEFHEAIARRDSIVLIKGARQMGKTSLLGRGLEQGRQAGARVLFTDFQQLNASHLESAEAFYQAAGAVIADQLGLDVFPQEVWDARLGPSMNFNRYVRRHVLEQIGEPIVWGLDEVEQLASYEFGSEVFGLLRSWHNQRVTDPAGPWDRLTLAIAYATEAHLLISNLNQSPFNVGTRLTLEDFTSEQVADLNSRYGSPLKADAEIARFHHLVSGQPYLVRCGLQAMAAEGTGIAELEGAADREDGLFGDHLRRILIILARNPELGEAVRGVLQGLPCPSTESFYRLRSAGIVAGESARDARPRCPLYAAYLRRHLL
jgi:DNA-binding SARP family transcriptional activator